MGGVGKSGRHFEHWPGALEPFGGGPEYVTPLNTPNIEKLLGLYPCPISNCKTGVKPTTLRRLRRDKIPVAGS